MIDSNKWDWETGEKSVHIGEWRNEFGWVEEPYTSPDGEKVAAIVNVGEMEFNVCINGETWENSYDKIWHLRFSADGKATALVSDMGEWTVAIDGETWENKFAYVWNPLYSRDGKSLAVAAQQEMQYYMVLNGKPWDVSYVNMTYFALSDCGTRTAGAVQKEAVDSGQIHKFKEGTFTAALDGKAWDSTFVNVWNLVISPDGQHLAAEVRHNLYDYTIAVDGQAWDKTFDCVWEPIFNPKKNTVIAPVRTGGQWVLAQDGEFIWDRRFVQLWQQQLSPDGEKLAAVVAPAYGRWTMAVNGVPWEITFSDMVTDAVFSPDGAKVAALAKEGEIWKVVVDGSVWSNTFDMAWQPVFSPDGVNVAARVEKNGKYTVVLNDHLWSRECEAVWDPVFSFDGDKLLMRSIEDSTYYRRIIPVSAFT